MKKVYQKFGFTSFTMELFSWINIDQFNQVIADEYTPYQP